MQGTMWQLVVILPLATLLRSLRLVIIVRWHVRTLSFPYRDRKILIVRTCHRIKVTRTVPTRLRLFTLTYMKCIVRHCTHMAVRTQIIALNQWQLAFIRKFARLRYRAGKRQLLMGALTLGASLILNNLLLKRT